MLPVFQRQRQDDARRILVPVQHEATVPADVRPRAESLLDEGATSRASLGRVLGRDSDDRDAVEFGIIRHPQEEAPPCCIVQALGEAMVPHQIADLEVFMGNQVVRRDERARPFAGEVLALPLHLQMRFRQLLLGLPIVMRLGLLRLSALRIVLP